MFLYQQFNIEAERVVRETPGFAWEPWKPTGLTLNPVNAVGSVEWTLDLFNYLGWVVPAVGGMFCPARQEFADMYLRASHMSRLSLVQPGLFVKPQPENMKAWTGLVATEADLEKLVATHGPNMRCEVQEPVTFENEWRLFLYKDVKGRPHLAGGAQYPVPEDGPHILSPILRGRSIDMPSYAFEAKLMNAFIRQPYVALVVDVGLIGNEWAVVEIGDVWATGTYGATNAYLAAQRLRFLQIQEMSEQ
jgi:hypothetical protein